MFLVFTIYWFRRAFLCTTTHRTFGQLICNCGSLKDEEMCLRALMRQLADCLTGKSEYYIDSQLRYNYHKRGLAEKTLRLLAR